MPKRDPRPDAGQLVTDETVPDPERQSLTRQSQSDVVEEARLFATYIFPGVVIDPAAIERYVAASRTVFAASPAARDLAIVNFVTRHPWSLRFLDSAAACIAPRTLLRKKLLLMLALLETTTTHAQAFVATPRSRLSVVFRLLWWMACDGCETVVGLVLWPFAQLL
jgi:hypothetical protein